MVAQALPATPPMEGLDEEQIESDISNRGENQEQEGIEGIAHRTQHGDDHVVENLSNRPAKNNNKVGIGGFILSLHGHVDFRRMDAKGS